MGDPVAATLPKEVIALAREAIEQNIQGERIKELGKKLEQQDDAIAGYAKRHVGVLKMEKRIKELEGEKQTFLKFITLAINHNEIDHLRGCNPSESDGECVCGLDWILKIYEDNPCVCADCTQKREALQEEGQ
jgi:hypothetical protein